MHWEMRWMLLMQPFNNIKKAIGKHLIDRWKTINKKNARNEAYVESFLAFFYLDFVFQRSIRCSPYCPYLFIKLPCFFLEYWIADWRWNRYPRRSRTPAAISQNFQRNNPSTPRNKSEEPFEIARLPKPARIGKIPIVMPNKRCHGRVNPLACVESAVPIMVKPRDRKSVV